MRLFSNIRSIVLDAIAFARNLCRSRSALAAENLFLRKQLTFFVERKQAPRRTDNATRVTMATLARKPDQHRHQLPAQRAVASMPVLGGLHHDYRLSRVA